MIVSTTITITITEDAIPLPCRVEGDVVEDPDATDGLDAYNYSIYCPCGADITHRRDVDVRAVHDAAEAALKAEFRARLEAAGGAKEAI